MLVEPVDVKLGNNGGDIEKVAVVEVVVVVITVPKVNPRVIGASFVDDAAPRGLVSRKRRRGGVEPVLEGGLEIVDNRRDKIGPSEIISGVAVVALHQHFVPSCPPR